jgi:hypothetical protein
VVLLVHTHLLMIWVQQQEQVNCIADTITMQAAVEVKVRTIAVLQVLVVAVKVELASPNSIQMLVWQIQAVEQVQVQMLCLHMVEQTEVQES